MEALNGSQGPLEVPRVYEFLSTLYPRLYQDYRPTSQAIKKRNTLDLGGALKGSFRLLKDYVYYGPSPNNIRLLSKNSPRDRRL